MKYLYGKNDLGYGGILPWDAMKNVPTSYKRNSKFMKKWL